MSRSAFLAVLLIAALAEGIPGQAIRGRLVDQAGGPLPPSLVTLVNESGAAERATASDGAGRFALVTGSAGRFKLRIERPGYQPFTSEPFLLDPDTTLELTLSVRSGRQDFGVVRTASGECVAGTAFGPAAGVWRQAAVALGIMALAEEAGMLDVRGVRYLRLLDSSGDFHQGVIEQEPFAGGSVPYPAPPQPGLPAAGFISTDSTGGLAYQLPSPPVLLSASFFGAHCIHRIVLDRGRRDQLGLAFRPAERSRVVGIEGVLWVDRLTAEPREIEFEYRDPARILPRGARGEMAFRTGKEGVPQVSRWWVRVPRVFETTYTGGGLARNTSTLESGAFAFDAGDRPLDDPEGVFALLTGMYTLNPIVVEAARAQRTMSEGALKQIRLDEIIGAPPTDAWDILRTLRPTWLARAESPALSDASSGGELVVYLDRMRISTLNGDPDAGDYVGAPAALSQIPAAWIASIEYIPPIEAAAIYGQGHGYGVVVIRSRRQ